MTLPDATFRRLVVVCLAVGSNLPDADLLYTSFAGGPLAYVLQHRGYTHTLVGALAAALLLWLACLLWLRYRNLRATPAEYAWLAAAGVVGVLLHLAMDYTNNYGVHPFWPFYNGWVYGDSVYIVEPLLWLAAAPLLFLLESTLARILVGLALAVGVLAVTAFGVVAMPAVILFVVLAGVMLAAARWLPPPAALGVGILLWLGVTATFAVAGRVAAGRLESLAQVQFPHSHTLDRVLTPTPADPVCWDAWLVQAQPGQEVMRQARISLLPGVIGVDACRGVNPGANRNDRGDPVPAAAGVGITWSQQFTLPSTLIADAASTQCQARAFMQFARVPMALPQQWGLLLMDLRFGTGRGRGFSQLQLMSASAPCDFAPVPWLPPRPELLLPRSSAWR